MKWLRPTALFLLTLTIAAAAETTPYHEYAVRYTVGDAVMTVATGRQEAHSIGSLVISLYEADGIGHPANLVVGRVFPRDGSVIKSWCADLDADGRPEVVVWLQSAGSGGYDTAYVFTVTNKNGAKEIERRDLGAAENFSGNGDPSHQAAEFVVENDTLRCRYPVYAEAGNRFSAITGWEWSHLDAGTWAWVGEGIQPVAQKDTRS